MTISWMELGVIASLIIGCTAFFVAVFVLLRARHHLEKANKLSERIARDLALANNGSVGMGQRLLAMEKRLQQTSTEKSKADPDDDEEFQAYNQAAQLFKLGFGAEEVAQRCGLSRAEASLMEMMQKASR
jgi:hypothetical protein